MTTFLNVVIVVSGGLLLLGALVVLLVVTGCSIVEWRKTDADSDAERSGEGIVWGATAHSMGKP